MPSGYPILEFDPSPQAVIEPRRVVESIDIPEHCVACFFQDVIQELVDQGEATVVDHRRSELGLHPVYQVETPGGQVALFHPGVGAPLAAGMLEEVIALGCRKFIACGGAGVLDSAIPAGRVVLPVAAVRDEGTSYHYIPPGREVGPHPEALEALRRTLEARGVPFLEGKTWTTDAFFRETPSKVRRRRAEGCLTVEMEASALFAVARFRGVPLAFLLYAGDDVGGHEWDHRDWMERRDLRRRLFRLAAEACLAL